MKTLFIISAIISCLSLSSCATLTTKTTRPLTINSEPMDADVSITNRKGEVVYTGKTPATVNLGASSKYMSGEKLTVSLSKPGFAEQKVFIDSKIDKWYWGNLVIGEAVGMLIIDPLTGAMYKFDTDSVNVVLENNISMQKP